MATKHRKITPVSAKDAIKAETARVGMTEGETILDRRITDTARTIDTDMERLAGRVDAALCKLSVRVSLLEVERKPWWKRWIG